MPGTDLPHHEKAQSLARQGKISEALDCYERALHASPDNEMILNNKAIALITLNRYEEALATCRKATALRTDCADIWTTTGVVYEKLGRYSDAADALEQAARLNPYDCYTHALLGIVYQKLNLEERAEEHNRKLQDLVFPNEYAGFFFGTAAFLLGILLGGIHGVEGKPVEITVTSQLVILVLFCIMCLMYWRSLNRLHQINRNVFVVPYPLSVQGDRSARGMYIVLGIMVVVFAVGIILGSDIWNWL